MTNQEDRDERDGSDGLVEDLRISQIIRRASGAGTWVSGTLGDFRFDALVFPEHAVNPAWEIGDSRISKLWVQRLNDQRTVYNWDRGLDLAPQDSQVARVVDFLCAGLAEDTYGHRTAPDIGGNGQR